MFPGAHAQIHYNEAGEPVGWDYPGYDDPPDPDDYDDFDRDFDGDFDDDPDVSDDTPSLAELRPESQPLPEPLRAAVGTFLRTHPMARVWWDYPHVSASDDEATDRWACRQVSEAFAAVLAERGITARLVHAEDAEVSFHDEHCWVRVDCPAGVVNVDWTARQFYNLEHPHDPAHADLPCPMVWLTGPDYPADTHPVTGRYRQVTENPNPAP